MLRWTDAHNHLQDPRLGETAPIIAAMKLAGVSHCVVNATQEADWLAVENLAVAEPEWVSPAFGVHPWHAHTVTSGWVKRLKTLLVKFPHSSIGECGLDTWITHPSLEIQRPVFIEQLRLARELERPVTIHCLKAWGALFDCFAEAPPPSRFLMHSFGGSMEVAQRLIPLGAYFSFSGHFLHPRKSAVLEVFRQLPLERILLETDAPDMLPPLELLSHTLPQNHHHPANLPNIGHALADALAKDPTELAAITYKNFRGCFGC
jgi:TatD DNase family protein